MVGDVTLVFVSSEPGQAVTPGKSDNRKLEIHMDGKRVKQDLRAVRFMRHVRSIRKNCTLSTLIPGHAHVLIPIDD